MAVQTLTGACHCGKVRIEADLDLAAGSNRCNEWGAKISKRMFCRHCGVHVFSRGYLEQIGGDYVSVNLSVLDVEPAALATISLRYFDGRNNNWMSTPQFTGYL